MLLSVRNLDKTFVTDRSIFGRVRRTVHAVKNLSFDLAAGETLAVVGESGSGKSTTARLVLRLIEPEGGDIRFEGTDVRAQDARGMLALRRQMQIIFQDPLTSFDPRVSIGESIAEPLRVHTGMDRAQRDREVCRLLDRVGMSTQDLTRRPFEFSGGQLQRASIARALTLKPKLIVCDECVAALDVSIRAQVLNLLAELQRELGMSYLFIAHDLSMVRAIAHRVLIMQAGEVVESGPIQSVFGRPSHVYTQELLAAVPSLR